MARLLVIGASGAGTSTLGRAVATIRATQHFDVDDFFWRPTDPPFTTRRPPDERLRLLSEMVLPRAEWVLSGSPLGWSAPIEARLTHAVFVAIDPAARLARLEAREARRYGARIREGGDLAAHHTGFMDWAKGYDYPEFTGRSRAAHDNFLERLACPVLAVDGAEPTEALAAAVCAWLDG
ncbi:P-loop NTPase family protein [Acidimangrovimonas sediminis]|uniref:hypothetical protein n=1 Tax=Acidimangrovimonas sediminis TaxID=2056283 RepID=UPI000C8008F4|nr:hypothetical protein [Acidimangrovimonas sediminis]